MQTILCAECLRSSKAVIISPSLSQLYNLQWDESDATLSNYALILEDVKSITYTGIYLDSYASYHMIIKYAAFMRFILYLYEFYNADVRHTAVLTPTPTHLPHYLDIHWLYNSRVTCLSSYATFTIY